MTHDQIDRMVRQANPVPELTTLEPLDASVLVLDTQRRTEMQTNDRVEVKKERGKPVLGFVVGIAAVAVVVVGVILVQPRDVVEPAIATGPFPDGIYRAEITLDSLLEAGIDQPTAVDHAGLWTLTFADGVLNTEDVNAASGERSNGPGVYCTEGGRVELGIGIDVPEPTCGDFWSAAWEVEGDLLRFVDVRSGHGFEDLIDALFERSWTKTG
jgi:hypothetical protein